MATQSLTQGQRQTASQRQIQKMSQKQIQAVRFLTLQTNDLREEIYKFAENNPALEIVEDVPTANEFGDLGMMRRGDDFYDDENYGRSVSSRSSRLTADEYQSALENQADETETLQEHLIHQLNMLKIKPDEKSFCTLLIYNLDKNGCYGNQTAPKTLLSQMPVQNPQISLVDNFSQTDATSTKNSPYDTDGQSAFIEKCLWIVQKLDPIGCCCKNLEESLFVQAKIQNPKDTLSLFLLDGNLEMLNPPRPEQILKKIKSFQANWHKKAFAPKLPIDDLEIDEFAIEESLNFILSLNPHPAAGFSYDSTKAGIQLADIALVVSKKEGYVQTDDYEKGIVRADDKTYFKVSYPSGNLPKVRIAPEFLKKSKNVEMQKYREKYLQSANDFLGNLLFRESTIVLQGCEIVKNQLEFFLKGPGHIKAFTRRQLAKNIGVHESTVSRVSSKHNSRFVQTDWGTFPISYFFSSGVPIKSIHTEQTKSANEEIIYTEQSHSANRGTEFGMESKISSEAVKIKIAQIIHENENRKNGHKKISDQKIADLLNKEGIKIARRTVTKYRNQL